MAPSVKNGLGPSGPRPARYTGASQNFRHTFPATPHNDRVPAHPSGGPHPSGSAAGGLPGEFLVTPYTTQQIQQMATQRSADDVAPLLAALPTEDQVRHPYDLANQASAGLTQALVSALQGTQHYQVGMAPAISGQYAQQAGSDQAGADRIAATLGGAPSQLAGSTGGAATALAVAPTEAANAEAGAIDAANLRGTNEQYLLNDKLAQALLGLQGQQAAVRAKGVSLYDQYLSDLQTQNHQIQQQNATNALNYAHLGIDQQNANTSAASLGARVGMNNANNATRTSIATAHNQTAAATATASNRTRSAATAERTRHDLATEATAAYRASHPSTSGTQRDPRTGFTTSQVTQHISSDLARALQMAQQAHKPQTGSPSEVDFTYRYHPVTSGVTDTTTWNTGTGHVSPDAWQHFQQSGPPGHRNWSFLHVAHPGAEVTNSGTVGGNGGGGPSVGYWGELARIEGFLRQQNSVGHYGWDNPHVVRYAQQILRNAGYAANPNTAGPPPP